MYIHRKSNEWASSQNFKLFLIICKLLSYLHSQTLYVVMYYIDVHIGVLCQM